MDESSGLMAALRNKRMEGMGAPPAEPGVPASPPRGPEVLLEKIGSLEAKLDRILQVLGADKEPSQQKGQEA